MAREISRRGVLGSFLAAVAARLSGKETPAPAVATPAPYQVWSALPTPITYVYDANVGATLLSQCCHPSCDGTGSSAADQPTASIAELPNGMVAPAQAPITLKTRRDPPNSSVGA